MSSEITQKEFGSRLKEIRLKLAISQKEMAEKLGMAVSTYQHYERGEREAPISLIPKITSFGFNLNWLLSGQGEPYLKTGDRGEGYPPAEPGGGQFGEPVHTDSNKVVEIEHIEIVKGFKDKPRALSINRELKDLETLDPEEFKMLEAYIKGTVDSARRRASREQGPAPERDPDTQDRRSGQDRRKSSSGQT